MNMKNYVFLFLLAGISLLSCSSEEEEMMMETSSQYEGVWSGRTDGSGFNGETTLTINQSGFIIIETVDPNDNRIIHPGTGRINDEGEIVAGSTVNFDMIEIVGSLSLETNRGSGTWNNNTNPGNGTWAVTKNN